MKKYLLTLGICFCFLSKSNAQLPSSNDNGEYGIALRIESKAKQLNLGSVHNESPKMRPTAGKGGWFLRFEKGWVYYNPKTNNTYALWGEIMDKWATQGYETGWLGFPISDIRKTPNQSGAFVHFDNGSIYWSSNTGAHCVGGSFRDYWKNKGWENSADLGFPKTDEIEIFVNGYTRYQQFEKGTLFWGVNKNVLYSNNPNATQPPMDNSATYELFFKPNLNSFNGKEPSFDGGVYLDLYGWMDIRAYNGNGQEVAENDGKSFSLFSIDKNKALNEETGCSFGCTLNFTSDNANFQRRYNFTQEQIDANAYIRITYWLNDYDVSSSNDYLKLQASNGSWKYNNGNHPYREIKLKDIARSGNKTLEHKDNLSDGSGEYLYIATIFSLIKR